MRIEIVPIHDIRPSTYNPRRADPLRLELVELSLKKLGFLSPIFADASGEILSGHQRHLIAQRLGMQEVPVCRVPAMSEDKRRALNLVFNRATNDMAANATSDTLAEEMRRLGIRAMAADMPDQEELHRCADAVPVATKELADANQGRWIQYAAQVAKTLRARGIRLPIICTPDNQVVNGIGRLQVAAEKGDAHVPVVYIREHEAAFAGAMLNLLSMDFDLHHRYADLLRYSSFRRPLTYRAGLGRGFYVEHFGDITTKVFNLEEPVNLAKWRRCYGKRVLDFGAGRFTDTEILTRAGIDVTPFEPYPVGVGSEVDKDLGRHTAMNLLGDIANNKRWDAVFISSVLNSVPFREDREHIAVLTAALAGHRGTAYAWTMAANHHNWRAIDKNHRNKKHESMIQFRLDYEPGILIGDLGKAPKVQKYHRSQELYRTFKRAYEKVKVKRVGVDLSCVAHGPAYSNKALEEAIEFEFDLPYPDGSRLGLVDLAKHAFRERGCLP